MVRFFLTHVFSLLICALLATGALLTFKTPLVQAATTLQCSVCSGTFTCSRYTTCSWTNPNNDPICEGANKCNYGDPTSVVCGDCTVNCTISQSSRSCHNSGLDCRIEDDGCTAGTTAATDCNFAFNPDPECGGSGNNQCGNGICQSGIGETSSTCPADCSSGGPSGPVCGNDICESGESCSNCQEDCASSCGWGACGDPSCSVDIGCAANLRRKDPFGTCVCDFAGCDSGNTCTGGGAPGATTLTPPNSGTILINSNNTVTVSWSAANLADKYNIVVRPNNQPCAVTGTYGNNTGCGSLSGSTYSGIEVTGTSYTFRPNATYGNRWFFRVRPVNTNCGTFNGTNQTSTFTIMANITGGFYRDNDDEAAVSGGMCTLAGALQRNPGTGATIIGTVGGSGNGVTGTYEGVIAGNDFTLTMPWWPNSESPNNILSFTPGTDNTGSQLSCTCPSPNGSSCDYSGQASPKTGVNFFLTRFDLSNSGWWQVIGGNIYAGRGSGVALNSYIPTTTCISPTCEPYLITRDSADRVGSSGVVITGGGAVDTHSDANNQETNVNEDGTDIVAKETSLTQARTREDFAYFKRLYSFEANPTSDLTTTPTDVRKPTSLPTNGRAYYYNGSVTIANPWTVAAGESIVIFIENGDLTISDPGGVQQLITVAEGGFLAFIVDGSIFVNDDVGNNALTNTTPNIEGVYIADDVFRVRSRGAAAGGDDRFVGAGTFVGWTRIDLQRDFDDGGTRKAQNNTKSVESFVFRPDFVRYVPERMARPYFVWQEVN